MSFELITNICLILFWYSLWQAEKEIKNLKAYVSEIQRVIDEVAHAETDTQVDVTFLMKGE